MCHSPQQQQNAVMQQEGNCSIKTRGVSFSTVEFKSHEMILGHNPATRFGPSIEIDWEDVGIASLELEEYEAMRPPRRSTQELIIPGRIRQSLLLESGYTMKQIKDEISFMERERSSKFGFGKRLKESVLKLKITTGRAA